MNRILAVLLFIAAVIIGAILLPPYLADYSVMTKDVAWIGDLNKNFLDTDILVPEFPPSERDPYAYTSVQTYTLTRNRQRGEWNGYAVNIKPTKLSDSHFHELRVLAYTSDDHSDRTLSWDVREITHYFDSNQNYPSGRYFRIMGTFQKGPVYYEVSGDLLGELDAEQEEAAVAELQALVDSMNPVTSIVKEDSP